MSGRDESHGKSAVRRYRQKKYLVHSHRMLKHRSVAYTMEQPSVYLRPLANEYNINIIVQRTQPALCTYTYTRTQASARVKVVSCDLTFQRETGPSSPHPLIIRACAHGGKYGWLGRAARGVVNFVDNTRTQLQGGPAYASHCIKFHCALCSGIYPLQESKDL